MRDCDDPDPSRGRRPLASRVLERVPPGRCRVRAEFRPGPGIGPLRVAEDVPVLDVTRAGDLEQVPGGVIDLAAVELDGVGLGRLRLARSIAARIAPGGWLLVGGTGPGVGAVMVSLLVRPRRWSVEGRVEGWLVLRRAHLGVLDAARSLGRAMGASRPGTIVDRDAAS